MRIKLSLSTGSFLWSHSLEESIKIASELGFDGVELWADRPHAWPRDYKSRERELKKLIGSYDLDCPSLCPFYGDLNLANPNPGIRNESIIQVKETIGLASELGSQVVLVVPGHTWLPDVLHPVKKVWELAVQAVGKCADYAGGHGLKIGIENVTGTKLVETSDSMLRMLKEVKSRHLGVIPDVANVVPLEDPVEFVRKLGRHIVLVHVADNDLEIPSHLPIGVGKIDFKAIIEVLKVINYGGCMTLEIFYPEDPVGGARKSIETLKTIQQTT